MVPSDPPREPEEQHPPRPVYSQHPLKAGGMQIAAFALGWIAGMLLIGLVLLLLFLHQRAAAPAP